MELLFILLHRNERLAPAIVWKKASAIAHVTAFIINQTVTLAGIPIAAVITLDTTYTC